jgi:hypothetical protein
MILELPEWSQVVSGLQRVTTESDLHLIQRLIVMFLSHPSRPEVAHSIIVNLVVGDKQSVPRYICLFAGHFPKVVDRLCVADVEVVHAAIERILGLNITKEYEEVFVHILPPMAEFSLKADIPPRIAAGLLLPQKQLLLSLGKKPGLATARIIVDYVLACVIANPSFCGSLATAIRQHVPRLSFQSVPIPQVILASGLVLAEKTQDDLGVAGQLVSLFAPIQQQGSRREPGRDVQVLRGCQLPDQDLGGAVRNCAVPGSV